MSRVVWLGIVFAGVGWCQTLDLSSLDKLEAKAKEVNRVTLDDKQLKGFMQMIPPDERKRDGLAEAEKMVPGLQSIVVRNYEFAEPGQYKDSDLDAIRNQIANLKGWSKIVDSRDKNEHCEVYMSTEGEKAGGIAVISAEKKEVSVVFVKGPLKLGDLGKLHGLMGLPNVEHSSKHDHDHDHDKDDDDK